MAIAITMERPKPIMVDKTKYVRKGDWDVTGLSKEEIFKILDESYEKAQEEVARGEGMSVEESYKKFIKDHSEWIATA